MAINSVKAHIGVVRETRQVEHPGCILVELFATGISEQDSLWMPFLCHTDINGFGLHSMPKIGDTVLVVGYGDTSDTYVAMANFWAVGQSPFFTGNDNPAYKVSYKPFDQKKKAEIKFEEGKEPELEKIKEVISEKELEIDANNADKLSKVFANTTLHYQWVIDESDEKNPTALISTRGGESVIQISNSGIDIYDGNEVNVFSQGNITIGAMGDVDILSKNLNIQANESFLVTSAGDIQMTSAEKVMMNGKEIHLNKKPENNEVDDDAPVEVGPPPSEGVFKVRLQVEVPYVTQDGVLTHDIAKNDENDYVTFTNYSPGLELKPIVEDDCMMIRDNSLERAAPMRFNNNLSRGSGQSTNIKSEEGRAHQNYVNAFYSSWIRKLTVQPEMNSRTVDGKVVTDKRLTIRLRLGFPEVVFAVPSLLYSDEEETEYNQWDNLDTKVNGEANFFVKNCLKGRPEVLFDIPDQKMLVKLPLKFPSFKFEIMDGASDKKTVDFSMDFNKAMKMYCDQNKYNYTSYYGGGKK